MRQFSNYLKRPITYASIAIGVAVIFCVQRIFAYSAEPEGEKNCPPLIPDGAEDATPPITSITETAPLPWSQRGGMINDASCLNQTRVFGIVEVRTEEDVRDALQFAEASKLKVSIAGVKHSMGGHAFSKNGVVLDMRGFNAIKLNEEQRTITVQSGATWHDIQSIIHPKYAVTSMQSTDIFTVGGSISVNAHGMDHRAGSVARSIRSMRVMLADGTVKTVSRTENAELFDVIIGGYGLFGVVLSAELDITDNDVYKTERSIIDYAAFPELFDEQLSKDENLGLFYGHLSTAPGDSFLRETILYTYRSVDNTDTEIAPLGEVSSVKLRRFVINLSKRGSLAMKFKWFTEKHIEPLIETCTINRNQAMKDGEECLVSRNDPMHDSVPYLKNNLKNDTDILQEYFIPRENFTAFVDDMRDIIESHDANLLNASVRIVHKEENFLTYAPKDAFAIVLYLNQGTGAEDNLKMQKVTRALIDATNKNGGRFFLPYQLHYTKDELRASYPNIDDFFTLKRVYDPEELLTNTWYQQYGKNEG